MDITINESIISQNKQDKNTKLLKHDNESQHTHFWKDDFKIFNDNYKSNVKKKISEVLCIKALKPTVREKCQREIS